MIEVTKQIKITDDLAVLLNVLPSYIKNILVEGNNQDLVEIVMDLGRCPEARFATREFILSDQEVTQDDIDYVTQRIGNFMGDNRAGIERTLHRISAIMNRHGKVIGLTCRVGRSVFGTVDIVQDILETGQSLLLLGPPGVGKTTLLREAARILAEKKRVVIVDTSNEIAGDGDIPHPAIGRARRMQVAAPNLQHEVMIEAVENHMPEVIIIDEIGRRLEAEAARTIAERGVQLVGTAHGIVLENLLMNPTLADLVGGIDSVTLSDEEARRRGTQKTVLERRARPTFDVLVEIRDRQTFAVHQNVAQAVDVLLRGKPPAPEIRYRDELGKIKIESPAPPPASARLSPNMPNTVEPTYRTRSGDYGDIRGRMAAEGITNFSQVRVFQTIKILPYGIGQNRLQQAAKALQLPIMLVEDLNNADVLITLKNYYRKRLQPIADAERMGKPVYVLRSNTVVQMESCLADIFSLNVNETSNTSSAMRETQEAIAKVMTGVRSVELTPQTSDVRKEQHEMVREANLLSHSLGRDPNRRVRIYQTTTTKEKT